MQQGHGWSQGKEAPLAHAAEASVKAKYAPSPMQRGPWWSQSEGERGPRWSQSKGGPLAHTAEASVVVKQSWHHRPCGAVMGDPKGKRPPRPRGGGLGQSEIRPLAHAAGSLVVAK